MPALRPQLFGAAALVLALAGGLAGCQPKTAGVDAPLDVAREADAIRGTEADRAIETGEKDLDKAAAHFAPTAILAMPGAGPVRGSAQIRSSLEADFQDPAFALDWKTDRIIVAKQGDLAWASGLYTLTRTDPATHARTVVRGPFLETFAKGDDSRWLITAAVLGQTPPPADQ
jgi:ketosteroid isomerase-like protein